MRFGKLTIGLGRAVLAAAFFAAPAAVAAPVTFVDLTGSEATEGFEGLATDADLPLWFGGWRTPVQGYTLPSGVRVYNLNNATNSTGQIIIGDTAIGSTGFGSSHSAGHPGTGPAVDGTAFIADNTAGNSDIRFELPYDVALAGIYATGTDNLTVRVYDSSLTLLETAVFNATSTFADWGTNFFGIATAGIRYIDFDTSDYWIADRLTFTDQTGSVPAPGAMALLAMGMFGLCMRRRTN